MIPLARRSLTALFGSIACTVSGLASCAENRKRVEGSDSVFTRLENGSEADSSWSVPLLYREKGVIDRSPRDKNVPYVGEIRGMTGIVRSEIAGDDAALVAAGDTLHAVRIGDGYTLWRQQISVEVDAESFGYAIGIAVDITRAYVVSSGGYVAACSLDAGERVWVVRAIEPRETGYETGGQAAVASWGCAEPVSHDGGLYLCFSSFELAESTTIMCLSCTDGSILWRHDVSGWALQAGGIGYPVATAAGLIAPLFDGPGIVLFDYMTGEELSRIETDGQVLMGFTKDATGCYLTQSRIGTLYRVWVHGGALMERHAVRLSGSDAKRLPTGARPIRIGNAIFCNAPVLANDANVFDRGAAVDDGSIAVFEGSTLALREVRDARWVESTPIVVDHGFYYLGWQGLYRVPADFSSPSEFSVVDEGVKRAGGAWDCHLIVVDERSFLVAYVGWNECSLLRIVAG